MLTRGHLSKLTLASVFVVPLFGSGCAVVEAYKAGQACYNELTSEDPVCSVVCQGFSCVATDKSMKDLQRELDKAGYGGTVFLSKGGTTLIGGQTASAAEVQKLLDGIKNGTAPKDKIVNLALCDRNNPPKSDPGCPDPKVTKMH